MLPSDRAGECVGDRIFISYRQADDPGFAGRIYDQLESQFTPQRIFMDVTGIKPGRDFVRELEHQVANCDILLAIIGKGWTTAIDGSGKRRLDDPEDWVRVEIDTALRLGKLVIPVLVNGAAAPRREEVPALLTPLLSRQFVRVSHDGFKSDIKNLIASIEDAFREIAQEAEREKMARAAQAGELGDWQPMSAADIAKRHSECVLPRRCVRIIQTPEQFPSALGVTDARFVFVADYDELRGRFLKDIIRDMFWSVVDTKDAECLAIKFNLEPSRIAEFCPLPATRAAMEFARTSASYLSKNSNDPNKAAMALFQSLARRAANAEDFSPSWEIDPQLSEDRHPNFFEGLKAGNFVQYQLLTTTGRGRSEFAARHFMVRNMKLTNVEFEVRRMGRASDLIALS